MFSVLWYVYVVEKGISMTLMKFEDYLPCNSVPVLLLSCYHQVCSANHAKMSGYKQSQASE